MTQQPPARSIRLDLQFEDLETQMKHCCDTSTTNPLCTCPITLTDCCAMVEMEE